MSCRYRNIHRTRPKQLAVCLPGLEIIAVVRCSCKPNKRYPAGGCICKRCSVVVPNQINNVYANASIPLQYNVELLYTNVVVVKSCTIVLGSVCIYLRRRCPNKEIGRSWCAKRRCIVRYCVFCRSIDRKKRRDRQRRKLMS